MKDYSKGKIYKIIDSSNGDIYIGSTVQTLKQRYSGHHLFYLYEKNRDDCEIFLIEDYPCENKQQLEDREKYYINSFDCINKMKCKQRVEGDYVILMNVFH